MNTPIVDQYVSDNYNVRIFDANHCFDFARRLELDRAALMEALEDLTKVLVVVAGETAPLPRIALSHARAALSAARESFPEQS